MRLLLVTQDFFPNTGGIETYCAELSKRFFRTVDRFAVLAPSHRAARLFDADLEYPVYRIPVKNSLLPLVAPIPEIYFSMKEKFDTVLHAQWQTVGASLISKKTGYPGRIFVAVHARELLTKPFSGRGGWISRILHRKRRKMFEKVDGFIPVSRYTASLLREEGVPDEKINIQGNGTDPRRFAPQNTRSLAGKLNVQQKKVIVTICRLVQRKGIDLVLSALRELIGEMDDVIYLVGGAGPDEQRLKSMVAEWNLENYVRFLGRVPDDQMASYYSLADVFVMPARNTPPDVEGFGIVFLEANACGTPVIGSKTGGIPDAVVEGKTGLLIEDGDVDQLYRYLKKVLADREFARTLGQQGRERVLNEANWDHVSRRMLAEMEKL